MKKVILAGLLVASLLLAACAVSAPQQATAPQETTQPATQAPTQAQPDEPSEEETDVFAALYPKDGNVPDNKQFQILAKELAEGVKGRIAEITYTWKGSKTSMQVLAGIYDDGRTLTKPEQSPLELVYEQSEFYNYVLYLPQGYDSADTQKKWPVIFFFHGIGESGSNLKELLDYGMPKYLQDGGTVDAIMIAPQCPGDSHWADTNVEVEKLVQFVPEMAQAYNIDTERMYLTGLSMGGRCTWKLALAMPDTFAAIAVVCGRTNTYEFDTLRTMPIWLFHGAGDGTVSFDNINKIVPLLVENEHRYFKLTVFPQLGHDIWTTVYARAEVYDWLLAQSLSLNAAQSEE